jgi:HK97 gp10 family phage protein
MADYDLQHVSGLRDFQLQLEQLPKNIAKNVLRGAVAAGAKIIRDLAIHLAPEYEPGEGEKPDDRVSPGRIKNAIFEKQIPERSSEFVQTFYVGVRRGKKQQIKFKHGKLTNLDAYYWTWVEFGHWYVPRRDEKWQSAKWNNEKAHANKTAIWVQPHPFMKPAFRDGRDAALDAMITYFETRIPAEAAKLGLKMT